MKADIEELKNQFLKEEKIVPTLVESKLGNLVGWYLCLIASVFERIEKARLRRGDLPLQ